MCKHQLLLLQMVFRSLLFTCLNHQNRSYNRIHNAYNSHSISSHFVFCLFSPFPIVHVYCRNNHIYENIFASFLFAYLYKKVIIIPIPTNTEYPAKMYLEINLAIRQILELSLQSNVHAKTKNIKHATSKQSPIFNIIVVRFIPVHFPS